STCSPDGSATSSRRALPCSTASACPSDRTPLATPRSTASAASPVSSTCACASTNPGVTSAPSRSTTRSARAASPAAVSSAPIHATTPSSTRRASAKGAADECTTPLRYSMDRAGWLAEELYAIARAPSQARAGHHPAQHRVLRPAGGGAQSLRRRGATELVQHVHDLLAPPHEVARRQVGAPQHAVEALAGRPPVHRGHQAQVE